MDIGGMKSCIRCYPLGLLSLRFDNLFSQKPINAFYLAPIRINVPIEKLIFKMVSLENCPRNIKLAICHFYLIEIYWHSVRHVRPLESTFPTPKEISGILCSPKNCGGYETPQFVSHIRPGVGVNQNILKKKERSHQTQKIVVDKRHHQSFPYPPRFFIQEVG